MYITCTSHGYHTCTIYLYCIFLASWYFSYTRQQVDHIRSAFLRSNQMRHLCKSPHGSTQTPWGTILWRKRKCINLAINFIWLLFGTINNLTFVFGWPDWIYNTPYSISWYILVTDLSPEGGTQIIFWWSVRPKVWNPYPYLMIFLTQIKCWIDSFFLRNFCKFILISKGFPASKTGDFTFFLQILCNGTLLYGFFDQMGHMSKDFW